MFSLTGHGWFIGNLLIWGYLFYDRQPWWALLLVLLLFYLFPLSCLSRQQLYHLQIKIYLAPLFQNTNLSNSITILGNVGNIQHPPLILNFNRNTLFLIL